MMHIDYNIRKAHKADLRALVRMENECFDSPWCFPAVKSEIENTYSCIYVAEKEEKIVGYLIIYTIADEAEIARIGVKCEYRRQGIATALLRNAMENFKGDMFIDVRVKNTQARSLYLKMGFEQIYIRKNYYSNPTEDAVVMKKHIGD